MVTLQIIKLVTTVLFYGNFGATNALQRNSLCRELSRKPCFDVKLLWTRTKPWRVYHTWNLNDMKYKCFDMGFDNATQTIINRIHKDMHEYVEYHPNWNGATVHSTMGTVDREILLIPEHGAPAGSFVGVPNVVRSHTIPPPRNEVPILKLFMKLIHDGKGYLLIADCKSGVITLSAREEPKYRAELALVVGSLGLGKGESACLPVSRTLPIPEDNQL